MSLILDALKKADRERTDNVENPSIDSSHKTPLPEPDGFVIKPVHGVIVLFFVLVVISLAFIFGKSSGEKPNSNQHNAAIPTQPLRTQIRSAPTITSKYSDFKKNIQEKKIALEYQSAETETTPSTATSPKQVAGVDQTENSANIVLEPPPSAKDSNTAEKTNATNDVSGIYDTPLKINKSVAAVIESQSAPLEPGNSIDDFPELGGIRDLPWTLQDQIPSMTYSAHDYSRVNPTVTINNAILRQGSKVENDLYIEKILEDGIILQFGQQRFKMQALSSWVNL